MGDTVVAVGGQNRTVRGAQLQEPPGQPNGGGINSSLVIPHVSVIDPLEPGESVHVQFRLGVEQSGQYRFCVHSETLPRGTGALIAQGGGTNDATSTDLGCGVPVLKGDVLPSQDSRRARARRPSPSSSPPRRSPRASPETTETRRLPRRWTPAPRSSTASG